MVLQVMSTSKTRWHVGLIVVALAVYGTMWAGWQLGWTWVVTYDASALDAAHRIAVEHPSSVTWWHVLCTVFSPLSFRILTLGLIVYALVRRRILIAAFLALSVELSGVLTEIAKHLADRPRPATAMVPALGTSFPSGHAVGSMLAVLALGVVLSPHLGRSARPWVIAAAVLIVVLVGVGRVALNVHNPSDVVAGWALGYVYFAACLPVLRFRTSVETPAAPGTGP